jgi:hypothetical protein
MFQHPSRPAFGPNQASCTEGTVPFPGVKQRRRGVDYPPPSSAEVKQSRDIPLPSSVPSWHVIGRNLSLPLHKLLMNYPLSKLMRIVWRFYSYKYVQTDGQSDFNRFYAGLRKRLRTEKQSKALLILSRCRNIHLKQKWLRKRNQKPWCLTDLFRLTYEGTDEYVNERNK